MLHQSKGKSGWIQTRLMGIYGYKYGYLLEQGGEKAANSLFFL